ncbi:MAG TPA: BON domain-containing protein [Nitrolancea sp.]
MLLRTTEELDREVQQDVLDELDWDPEIAATDVGVEVNNRVVTLTGTVDSFAKKWAAERAVLRVARVRAVANDIAVRLFGTAVKNDTDIAQAVANALEWGASIPFENIDIKVENGDVTLSGEVPWNFQRTDIADTVRRISGVKAVINLITLSAHPSSAEKIRADIERALVRNAEVDADAIRVRIEDRHAFLTGTVHAWSEKQAAEEAAWRAPGITVVTNEIRVEVQ